jgi:hypothetical protein
MSIGKIQRTKIQDASETPFDNSSNGFTADNVQGAIEEIGASASPGFTWGRSATNGAGTWLLNDGVPSNRAGRTIVLGDSRIVRIFSATEDANTYTIDLYWHEGNEINLTYLTTLTVIGSRSGNSGTINVSVPNGKQLAALIATGSAKNIVVGIVMQGDT